MSETPERPTSKDDRDGWKAYWAAQGMPWRTEPEIDGVRQSYFAKRLRVNISISKGIYPFREKSGSIKLSRADIEWLLANHESRGVKGPVDWTDEQGKPTSGRRGGLDLRGADLSGVTHLANLPLAGVQAGLRWDDWERASRKGREWASARMDNVSFSNAHIEGGTFCQTHLDGAYCRDVHATEADLRRAFLRLAYFRQVDLRGVKLTGAQLQTARLSDANLEGVDLRDANLAGADLEKASLGTADLRGAFFDAATRLRGARIANDVGQSASLADVRWGDVNLAVVDWTQIQRSVLGVRKRIAAVELGDEREARTAKDKKGKPKDKVRRLQDYLDAVRANRQLATVLRSQGLNEDADRFAYQAQKLQRQVLRRQGRRIVAFGSWILDVTSGYGYRPLHSVITYALVVLGFTAAYFVLRDSVHPALSPLDSFIFSITSFHGRGFSPSEEHVGLSNPLTIFAAIEAIIGLLIEITFIATFTQRFFAR